MPFTKLRAYTCIHECICIQRSLPSPTQVLLAVLLQRQPRVPRLTTAWGSYLQLGTGGVPSTSVCELAGFLAGIAQLGILVVETHVVLAYAILFAAVLSSDVPMMWSRV